MSPMTGRSQTLTPQSLLEMATSVVVIRAWQKWEGSQVLRINLVARGTRANPLPPLLWVNYETGLPFGEDVLFLRFPPRLTLEKQRNLEQGTQVILNFWEKSTPFLCMALSAFACRISNNGGVVEMPAGRLSLMLHYIRLRTLLETQLETKCTFDDNLEVLLSRFDSFIQQQIKGLDQLGEMLSMS